MINASILILSVKVQLHYRIIVFLVTISLQLPSIYWCVHIAEPHAHNLCTEEENVCLGVICVKNLCGAWDELFLKAIIVSAFHDHEQITVMEKFVLD